MPSRHRVSINPEARDDIRSILQYTFQTWGRAQRDRYQAQIQQALQELADFPLMAPVRDDLPRDYRARVVEQHVVFYRIETNVVRVIRVLHVKRDAARELP